MTDPSQPVGITIQQGYDEACQALGAAIVEQRLTTKALTAENAQLRQENEHLTDVLTARSTPPPSHAEQVAEGAGGQVTDDQP